MAITQTAFDTQLEAVITAIDADDYQSARKALTKAKVIMSGLADTMVGGRSVRYREQTIATIEASLDALEASSSDGNANKRVFCVYTRS